MHYKVKVSISCPDAELSASLFLTVPLEDMHYFFSFLPLYFCIFKQFVSPRTASRYRYLFSGDGEYAFCNTLSCTLIARA